MIKISPFFDPMKILKSSTNLMDKFEDPNGKRVKLYQNLSLTKKMKPKN
jgi:hypothetical protein